MNVNQKVSHFVVVVVVIVVGQSQSLVFVVEGYTRKLPIKLIEFGLVVSKRFSKANQKVSHFVVVVVVESKRFIVSLKTSCKEASYEVSLNMAL